MTELCVRFIGGISRNFYVISFKLRERQEVRSERAPCSADKLDGWCVLLAAIHGEEVATPVGENAHRPVYKCCLPLATRLLATGEGGGYDGGRGGGE